MKRDAPVDYTPLTRSVQQPVLVITGRKDYAVGPDHHKRFHFPNQRVVTLDSGHMPYFENTAEFSSAIRAFIEAQQL